MAVTKDNDTYEQQQLRLLRDLLLAIRDELENADLDDDQVAELTGRIGYAVASAIDGHHAGDDVLLRPRLAFAANHAGQEQLIVNDRGSYLHELVYSLFAEVFEDLEAEDDFDDEELDTALEEAEEYDQEGDEDDDEGDDGPGRIH